MTFYLLLMLRTGYLMVTYMWNLHFFESYSKSSPQNVSKWNLLRISWRSQRRGLHYCDAHDFNYQHRCYLKNTLRLPCHCEKLLISALLALLLLSSSLPFSPFCNFLSGVSKQASKKPKTKNQENPQANYSRSKSFFKKKLNKATLPFLWSFVTSQSQGPQCLTF